MKKIERSQHVSDWIWKSLGSQPSCLKNKTTKTHVTKERENKCEKVGDLQVQSWEWWGEPREVADMQPSRAWYGPKGGRGGGYVADHGEHMLAWAHEIGLTCDVIHMHGCNGLKKCGSKLQWISQAERVTIRNYMVLYFYVNKSIIFHQEE